MKLGLMARFLGKRSGLGLVFANMVGSGVFLSAGFMAQDLTAGQILLSWVVGCFIALAGARAYAELAGISGESGGEYRYLTQFMHPYPGYVAGWASLLIGFSATIALDAFAAGAFLQRVWPGVEPKLVGALIIIALTLAHALQLNWSKLIQNGLVVVKIAFVVVFATLGLALGSTAWPTWEPANAHVGFPTEAFILNQYWVAFAFSGWNAAIYAAAEFEDPKRDVPFACLVGCLGVGLLYLVLNWVFVANLTPEAAAAVFQHEETRITLAHVVAVELMGENAGVAVSLVAVLVMVSAMSAMTLIGPRVYAAMADDGLLPKVFRSRDGKPPIGSVFLQGGIALALLLLWTVLEVVQSASAVLMLSSGLTAAAVFFAARKHEVRPVAMVAAALYILCVGTFLVVGSFDSLVVAGALGVLLLVAGIGYVAATRSR